MKALLLIDLQNDFCHLGALEVKEANSIIPIANDLMSHFDEIVASQDWHPADHLSFAANHYWKKPGQIIDLNGLEQILWPIHCVQNSMGAAFHDGLNTQKITKVIYKGTDKSIDSYSVFYDNGHLKATDLHDYLQSKNIKELYILGLATDYCVQFTVLDALELNYTVYLIQDACKAVNLNENDGQNAILKMQEKGAIIINSNELLGL